jgi:hypothetical protein
MKNIKKSMKNQLRLANTSSQIRRDRKYFSTVNYSPEILEKRINQIFEKNKYDGYQKNRIGI